MNAIEWLEQIFDKKQKDIFLIDTLSAKKYTFKQFQQEAVKVGAYFKKKGIKRGDRIAFVLNNSADFCVLYLACLYSGIVTIPINPILGKQTIEYIIKNTKVERIIISPDNLNAFDLSLVDDKSILVLHDSDNMPKTKYPILNIGDLPKGKNFKPFHNVTPDDTMTIIYTSGTTSTPVGVVHRIRDMINNARLFNRQLGINDKNRFYNILSLGYLGGYYNLLMLPLAAGASVVLDNAFDAKSALNFWKKASQYKVNTLWLVPTIINILMELDRGEFGEQFCRKNIKLVLSGTAPLQTAKRKSFESRYGVPIYENYALSETFFLTSTTAMSPVVDDSVGRFFPNIEIAIINDKGQSQAYGQEGEILVRTPFLMEGYFSSKKNGPDEIPEGEWFSTGDIGVLSPTGELYVTGRKKDLIIRGGINISPAETEQVLSRHKSIKDCAVIGIPHAIYGEDLAAAVELNSGIDFIKVKNDIIKFLKKNLSSIKVPSKIFDFENLPRNTAGKIQKRVIKKLLVHKLGLENINEPKKILSKNDGGKKLMLPGRIKRNIQRINPEFVEKIKKYPSSIISDCMNRLGMMNSNITSLVKGRSCVGSALTVEEVEAGNIMSHASLELIQPGDILVIDAKGVMTRSCFGGLQLEMAKQKGVSGVVIQGTVRDYQEIVEMEVPVFAMGFSPGGPLKSWGGNINYPISCGGVVVNPGDLVVGDDDGIVVVPRELMESLLPLCEERLKMEEQWFLQIKQGQATLDVVPGLRNKLEKLGVIYD